MAVGWLTADPLTAQGAVIAGTCLCLHQRQPTSRCLQGPTFQFKRKAQKDESPSTGAAAGGAKGQAELM